MITIGQLKKMLIRLEATGKVNDNIAVVINADEFNYWYSPTIDKAEDMLIDMNGPISDIELKIEKYNEKIANASDQSYINVCKNAIERNRKIIDEYKALGGICVSIMGKTA